MLTFGVKHGQRQVANGVCCGASGVDVCGGRVANGHARCGRVLPGLGGLARTLQCPEVVAGRIAAGGAGAVDREGAVGPAQRGGSGVGPAWFDVNQLQRTVCVELEKSGVAALFPAVFR